jgi:hypothetical protein
LEKLQLCLDMGWNYAWNSIIEKIAPHLFLRKIIKNASKNKMSPGHQK